MKHLCLLINRLEMTIEVHWNRCKFIMSPVMMMLTYSIEISSKIGETEIGRK